MYDKNENDSINKAHSENLWSNEKIIIDKKDWKSLEETILLAYKCETDIKAIVKNFNAIKSKL